MPSSLSAKDRLLALLLPILVCMGCDAGRGPTEPDRAKVAETGTEAVSTAAGLAEVVSTQESRRGPVVVGWAGTWDFTVTVVSSSCPGEVIGSSEELCVTIQASGNILVLDDGSGDGLFIGSVQEGVATLNRSGDNPITLVVGLAAGGVTLQGTATSGAGCATTHSVVGVRIGSCLPSAAWSGYWDMTVVVRESSCDRDPGETSMACTVIELDGDSVTMIAESDPPIPGSAQGNIAVLHYEDSYFELDIDISLGLDGDSFSGTASSFDFIDECFTEFTVTGVRRSTESCGFEAADWAGYWNFDGELSQNECDLSIEPGCVEILQVGSAISLDGVVLELVGNLAMGSYVDEYEGGSTSVYIELNMGSDANSFVATQIVTISSGTSTCTSILEVYGTRTLEPCKGSGALLVLPAREFRTAQSHSGPIAQSSGLPRPLPTTRKSSVWISQANGM